jgi:SAGA-associated factor 29
MADQNKHRRSKELDRLREDVTERYKDGSTPKHSSVERDAKHMASQRSRSARAQNRNFQQDEEVVLWDQSKNNALDVVKEVNTNTANLKKLLEIDKKVGSMNESELAMADDERDEMEKLCRAGVKETETALATIHGMIEKLKMSKILAQARERDAQAAAGPSKRSATRESTREAKREAAATPVPAAGPSGGAAASNSSLYDFDGVGDSPMPSPVTGSSSRGNKLGSGERDRDRDRDQRDRGSNRDRDSMPPKADSVEPQGPNGGGNKSSKVTFQKGDAVAFRPKAGAGGGDAQSDWILGEVAQVLGEGKSRRYKVLDVEPDDHSKQKEYRSSASSMIPITAEDQASTLRDWEAGKVVLALYPLTTTFYKAEVHSMSDDGGVNLKFEGENDSTTLQKVERRFVIEYRA